jgi:hypothetical protein
MINNNNLMGVKKKRRRLMGPQDQHHEMGYMTASLIYGQCGEWGCVC